MNKKGKWYEIVESTDKGALAEEIEKMLNDGWEVLGGPFCRPYVSPESCFYCQGMVFYEISDE